MAEDRSIEVRVGIVLLVAFGILAAFVLVMGGLTFQKTYPVFVDFDNPGGLQSGAPVKIGGVKVGKVSELEFRGGQVDPKTGRRTLVRVKLAVEERVRASIHDDADFYVTTQGVLGEQFLAIEPGSGARPALVTGAVVKGIDPPRLDLFLAKGYELLDTTMAGIRNNRELIADIATNTAGLLRGLNHAVSDNKERIDRTLANVEALSSEAAALAREARGKYVNNPRIDRTLENLERISEDVRADSGPMLKDAREALGNLNRASATVGAPEQQARVKKALEDIAELATRANATAADAQAIVKHVRSGKGSVGALVMDEQLYDEVQEMVRDLKHNPWKFLWKQ